MRIINFLNTFFKKYIKEKYVRQEIAKIAWWNGFSDDLNQFTQTELGKRIREENKQFADKFQECITTLNKK